MKRSAFTLIELLIVIVIMGVIYTLAISNFSKLTDKSNTLRLDTLKEYLASLKYDKTAELLCLDDCSECDVYLDGNKTEKIEGLLDKSVRVYRYEDLYGFVEKEPEPYFNSRGIEESVCFSYRMDSKKIGDQTLIEYKGKYYDMSTYFEATPVYNSIQEAQDVREKLRNEVLQ